MKVHERLRVIRHIKDWTQEEMAEKLGYSPNGYTKVERGETDITVGKLEKIAETLGVSLPKLLGMDEGNVFNFAEHCNYGVHNVVVLTESQCAQELEKANLLLSERLKEIEYLKNEIRLLQEKVEWMGKRST